MIGKAKRQKETEVMTEKRSSFLGFEPEPEPEPKPPPAPPEPEPIYRRVPLSAKKSEGFSGDPPLESASEGQPGPKFSSQATKCRKCGKSVGPIRRLASSNFCSRRCATRFEKETGRLEAVAAEIDRVLLRPKPPPYGDACRNWLWHRSHLVKETQDVKSTLRRR